MLIQIIESLKNLGLNDKEAKVYLKLIDNGKSTAYKISKETKIPKTNVYSILEDLRHKNFVKKLPSNTKLEYIAKDPKDILEEYNIKSQNINKFIPELISKYSLKNKNMNAYFFDGKEEMVKALNYRINEIKNKEMCCFFANANHLSNETIDIADKFMNTFVKNNIKIKGIASKHESLKDYRKTDKYKNIIKKEIDSKIYSSDISISITDIFVRVENLLDNQAVIIENAHVIKTFKQIFDMVWGER